MQLDKGGGTIVAALPPVPLKNFTYQLGIFSRFDFLTIFYSLWIIGTVCAQMYTKISLNEKFLKKEYLELRTEIKSLFTICCDV